MMWKSLALVAALSLAGCSNSAAPAQALFASAATLDQLEVAATAYVKSPVADPAVVAKLKSLDNIAYGQIHPLVDQAKSGANVVTAVEAQAAADAVNALSQYLVSVGASK